MKEIYKDRLEKEAACRQGLINSFPHQNFTEESGIYIFYRNDSETGLKFAYIGQAKNMMRRLVQHCMCADRSHIDRSLIKRKFYNPQNPDGWKLVVFYCPEEKLNEMERSTIKNLGNGGYQLLNKTSGGQDDSKEQINEYRPAKGYYDGLRQGWKNARVFVANLFDKNLVAMMSSGKECPRKAAALEKFKTFLAGECEQEKSKKK